MRSEELEVRNDVVSYLSVKLQRLDYGQEHCSLFTSHFSFARAIKRSGENYVCKWQRLYNNC